MIANAIYVLTIFILLIISAVTFSKAPKNARLPMQWGLNGQVTWSAPIKWAVLFTPAVTIICIVFILFITRAEDMPVAIDILLASILCVPPIFIHAGHMYIALRQFDNS